MGDFVLTTPVSQALVLTFTFCTHLPHHHSAPPSSLQYAQVLCGIGGGVIGMVGHSMLTTPLVCASGSINFLGILTSLYASHHHSSSCDVHR